MFRAKKDNNDYSEAKRPKGAGTWYVFYYDARGRKVRHRTGPNKGVAPLAKGDIEARLERHRAGLLDPDKELKRKAIAAFRDELPGFLETDNKAPKTITRYCGVFGNFCEFLHLVMQGVGIETVSRLLGHSNIQVTGDHYVHLAPQRMKDAVEVLEWE